ncbi:MAG: urea transporter [Gemmatimonadaceae bacterium]|nr:urea transporter [Gemmatimonadaceae bacterium]
MSASSPARVLMESALRPFAQTLLSRDLGTGLLVLLAIATQPRLGVFTVVAVAVSQVAVRAMGLGEMAVREGIAACAAILTTLALVSTLGEVTWSMVIGAAVLSVFVTTALQALFSRVLLPPLAVPFVASAWIALLASRVWPPMSGAASSLIFAARIPTAWPGADWLNIPASMIYVHGAVAGLLVLAAIAWHSRIALLLAMFGAAGAAIARAMFRPDVLWSDIDTMAAFNAMLTAMALGGVWFVPHVTSIALALIGAMLTAVLTWALSPVAGALGLPLLSLPFAITTLLVLLAARMREHDRWPTSAVPADRPEDALTSHLMRIRRFGDFAWLPFRLPFRGAWVVTQAHNGAHTHKGPWRFAFDFEVASHDGRTYDGAGTEVTDFRCYGLPILAAGTGTVEQIIDGVPDNAVGGVNARDNWGNTVVMAHGANLFSVYAHLRSGSIRVKVGDRVKAGAELGRCGNSGRSLTPHLHFQVQRGAVLGSETVPADFGDVITRHVNTAALAHRVIPMEGDTVRPIVRDDVLARALAFPAGSEWLFEDPLTGRREHARVEVDLYSRLVLQSDAARVYLEVYDTGLVVIAFDGSRQSLLRSLPLALARMPFDQESSITWSDRVPRRLMSTWASAFVELLAVVAPGWTDHEIRYQARRHEGTVVVEGTTSRYRTRTVVSFSDAPHRIEVRNVRDELLRTVIFHPVSAAPAEHSA